MISKILSLWHYVKVFAGKESFRFMLTSEYKSKYLSFRSRQRCCMEDRKLTREETIHNENWGKIMFAFMYYTGYNIFESMTEG